MHALTRADLRRFLGALARRLPCPLTVVLTGGAQAMLLGGRRPTRDIDFWVVLAPGRGRHWSEVEQAIAEAGAEARVPIQYSTDIDRWSQVAVPAAQRRTRFLRRQGGLSVHLLDPACWAVYKLARYLESDIEDLRAVLRRQRVPASRVARLCGESVRASPRSAQLFLFRRQVEHFFRTHGRSVWGARFEPPAAIRTFHRAADIPL